MKSCMQSQTWSLKYYLKTLSGISSRDIFKYLPWALFNPPLAIMPLLLQSSCSVDFHSSSKLFLLPSLFLSICWLRVERCVHKSHEIPFVYFVMEVLVESVRGKLSHDDVKPNRMTMGAFILLSSSFLSIHSLFNF